MVPFSRKAARALLVLALVCVGVSGAALSFLHSPFFRYAADGEYPAPRIDELIWPTVGYPSLVTPGEELVVEVDLSGGGEEGAEAERASGWRASIEPSREELAALSIELEPVGAELAPSRRWPCRGGEGGEAVWHVSFRVPEGAPPKLYDLRLEADVGGERIADAQPHAVAVMEDDDDDFTFITLADVHVHERDNSSLFQRQTDKGIGEGGEPVFLAEAAGQVNLIRPDFVLVLGDFVRGQRRPGELLSEFESFYEALMQLEVPAFLLAGNHDGYVNEIDGKRWYEDNLGPLYYSFDVGGCHFTCLDTYQWPEDDRVVMNKLIYMEPRKWQGQVLGAEDEGDPATYRGQLAWLEGDLSAHRGAPLKVMALHHDPYTPEGKGYSYDNVVRFPAYLGAGGGAGRRALLGVASRHGVDVVFGGHQHRDWVGSVPWEDGAGETAYSCQTCVYFGPGGVADNYPGYRLVEVEDGGITSLAYLDGVSSYPFYDGSVPGGETDLDSLEEPALWALPNESVAGEAWSCRIEVGNYLGESMELAGIALEAPSPPPGGYRVEGAELYRVAEIAGEPGRVLLYLRAQAGRGAPGDAAITTITVSF